MKEKMDAAIKPYESGCTVSKSIQWEIQKSGNRNREKRIIQAAARPE
jgi:RNase P protein component